MLRLRRLVLLVLRRLLLRRLRLVLLRLLLRLLIRLLRRVVARIVLGHRLILEIGVTQAEPVESLLMRSGMVVESAVPDLSGRIRVLVTRRG